MQLTVLGSGGFMPFPNFHMPGFALKIRGKNILFDCGEGIQTRMVEHDVSRSKLEAICISHVHGDHVLGLPGVLIRRSHESSDQSPLRLLGPSNLPKFTRFMQRFLLLKDHFSIDYVDLSIDEKISFDNFCIHSMKLDHRVENYGFAVSYAPKQRNFHPQKARTLGIPKGPLWGKLQNGQKITLSDGRTINPNEVSTPKPRQTLLVYITDTRPINSYPNEFKRPKLLIHEGMFLEEHKNHALEKKHATAKEAGKTARNLDAQKSLLTHRSQRYESYEPLVNEAQDVFDNTNRAEVGMKISIEYDG